MARCLDGHEQRLGIKCSICGAELSYKDSIDDLVTVPKVEPNYGESSVLTVGYPGLAVRADYVGEVSVGQDDLEGPTMFQMASIRGGNWLDFKEKYLWPLSRWFSLVGLAKSADRFVIVDTTSPLAVLALSAMPKVDHTAVIAVAADHDSTPVEQNASYVALSLALKRGLPVIAVTETFKREMLYFTEDEGFATNADAMSGLLGPLLTAHDDLLDLLAKDLKLGIRMHCLSAIIAGTRNVYGAPTNAFMAQSYNISMGKAPEEYQTVHSLAFANKDERNEFEKGFGVFRNRRFKGALSAEFRFHESSAPLYDLMTIYGLSSITSLSDIAGGYEAIVRSVPELSADGVS